MMIPVIVLHVGGRLKDFQVLLSDTNPAVTATEMLTRDEHVCTYYKGAFGESDTLACQRPVTGRYLTVLKGLSSGPLTLCEVEVYGECKQCQVY